MKSEGFCYFCQKLNTMKEDYRKLTNKELSDEIQRKMQELIDLRTELSRRTGDVPTAVNYDFTQRVTK